MELKIKKIIVFLLILLTGCASKIINYSPTVIKKEQAQSVIEQILMEQPLSERPEQVFFHEEYIGYKNGTLSKNRSLVSAVPIGSGAIASGRSVGTSKVIQTRIYFNSIESATLYLKNKYFIVITRNKGGSILNRSVIDTQEKAERFVDALMFFKNQ